MRKALHHKKKKINLRLPIYLLMITTILVSVTSMAKFGTTYLGSGNAIVAVPVLETARINLEDINPQMTPINYDLIVKNTKGNIKNQVTLNYEININYIGNVPLIIKIYNTETNEETGKYEKIGDNILQEGKTEPITMTISETVHTYIIEISWDTTIEDYDSYIYNGETSYLEIKVDAVQKD